MIAGQGLIAIGKNWEALNNFEIDRRADAGEDLSKLPEGTKSMIDGIREVDSEAKDKLTEAEDSGCGAAG